jgi:hypothetical protein
MVWGVHCCSLREIHHLIVLVLALYSQSPLALVLFDLPLLLLPDTTLLQNHHQNIFTSWTSAFYSNPVLVSVSNDNVNNNI